MEPIVSLNQIIQQHHKRNLVCGYWCFAENQYREITGFVKNLKEDYDYYGSNINSLLQHQVIY